LEKQAALKEGLRQGHPVRSVNITPDGKYVLSKSQDGLKIWELVVHDNEVEAIEHKCSANYKTITPDMMYALLTLTENEILPIPNLEVAEQIMNKAAHLWGTVSTAMTPDAKCIVFASWDGRINVLYTDKNKFQTISVSSTSFVQVMITPDGKYVIFFVVGDPKIRDLAKNKIFDVKGQADAQFYRAIAVTQDSKYCILWSSLPKLGILDIEKREVVETTLGNLGTDTTAVGITKNGEHIVFGSEDGTIEVWNSKENKTYCKFECDAAATCCTLHDTGIIVIGDNLGTTHISKIENGKAI
jgi:WD40 repeat protein